MSENTSMSSWSNNTMGYLDKINNSRIKELLKEIEEGINNNTINLEEIEKEIDSISGDNIETVLTRIINKINTSNSWIQEKIDTYNNVSIDSSKFNEHFEKLNNASVAETTDKIYQNVYDHITKNEPANTKNFRQIIDDASPQPMALRGINIQLFKEIFGLREFINCNYDTDKWYEMLDKYIQVIKIPIDTTYKSFEFGLAFKQNIYNISANYDIIQKINRNFSGKIILTNTSNNKQMECKMIIYNADTDPGTFTSESINPSFEFSAFKDEDFLYIFCSKLQLFNLIALYLASEVGTAPTQNVYKGLDADNITTNLNHGFNRNIEVKDKKFISIDSNKKWFVPVDTNNEEAKTDEKSNFELFSKNKIKAYRLDDDYLKMYTEEAAAINEDKKYFINFVGDVYNVFDINKDSIDRYYPICLNLSTGTGSLSHENFNITIDKLDIKTAHLGKTIPSKLIVNNRLSDKWGSSTDNVANIDTTVLVKKTVTSNSDPTYTLTNENNLYLNKPNPFFLKVNTDKSLSFDLIKNLLNNPKKPVNRIYHYNIVKTLSNEYFFKEETISTESEEGIDNSVNLKSLTSFTGLIDEEIKMLHLKVKTDTKINDSTEILTEVKEIIKYLDKVPSEILRVDDKIFIYFVKSKIDDVYKRTVGDRYLDYKFNEKDITNVIFEDGRIIDLTDHPEFTDLYNFYKSNNYITENNETPELFLELLTEDFSLIIDQEKEIELNTNGVSLNLEVSEEDKVETRINSNASITVKALAKVNNLILTISTEDVLGTVKTVDLLISVKEKPSTIIKSEYSEINLKQNAEQILTFESNANDLVFEANKESIIKIEKLEPKKVKITALAEDTCSLIVKGTADYSIENSITIPINISNTTILKTPEITEETLLFKVDTINKLIILTNDQNYTINSINKRVIIEKNENYPHYVNVTVPNEEINFDIDISANANDVDTPVTKRIRCSVRNLTDLNASVENITVTVEQQNNVDINTSAETITVDTDNHEIATAEVVQENPKQIRINAIAPGECKAYVKATATDKLESILELPIIVEDKPETKLLATTLEADIHIDESLEIGIVTTATEFILETQSNEFLEITKTEDGLSILGKAIGNVTIIVKATAEGCKETTREIKVNILDYETILEVDTEKIEDLINVTNTINVDSNANVFTVEIEDEEVASIVQNIKYFTVRGLKKGKTNINVKATAENAAEKIVTIPVTIYEEKTTIRCTNYTNIDVTTRETVVLDIETDAPDFEMSIPESIKDKIIYNHDTRTIYTLQPFETVNLILTAKNEEKDVNTLEIPFTVSVKMGLEDAVLKQHIDELQNLYFELLQNEGSIDEYNAVIDDIHDKFNTLLGIEKDPDSNLIYDVSKEYYEKVTDDTVLEDTSLTIAPDAFILSSDEKSHHLQIVDIQTDAEDFDFTIQGSSILSFDKESKTVTGIKEGWGIINIFAKADGKARVDKQIYVKVVKDCPAEASKQIYTETDSTDEN